MCSLASRTLPAPLTLEFRVHGPAGRAGLARWVEAIRYCDSAVMPLPLIDQLALYRPFRRRLAPSASSLSSGPLRSGLRRRGSGTSRQGRRSSGAARCYAVPRCAAGAGLDAAALPTSHGCPSSCATAPSAIASACARPGSTPSDSPTSAPRSSRVRVDARINCAHWYAIVRCRRRYGCLPILQAQIPAPVLFLDVPRTGFPVEGVRELYGADPRDVLCAYHRVVSARRLMPP